MYKGEHSSISCIIAMGASRRVDSARIEETIGCIRFVYFMGVWANYNLIGILASLESDAYHVRSSFEKGVQYVH